MAAVKVLLPDGDAVIFGDPAAVSVYLKLALELLIAIVTVVMGALVTASTKLPVPAFDVRLTTIDALPLRRARRGRGGGEDGGGRLVTGPEMNDTHPRRRHTASVFLSVKGEPYDNPHRSRSIYRRVDVACRFCLECLPPPQCAGNAQI